MITLFHGSGSAQYEADSISQTPAEWSKIRRTAVSLLTRREHARAAGLLESCNFNIYRGKNDFGDDFHILYRKVGLDDYLRFESYSTSIEDKMAFRNIAKIVTEIGPYIRFIGVELSKEPDLVPVKHPELATDSAAVERALIDAENLIASSGAVSAVDRVHTALHGYLKGLCREAGVTDLNKDCKINDALKILREKHSAFEDRSDHDKHTLKILRSMGNLAGALDPLRNHGSVAHANDNLLDEAEAMLAINAARTILHYIHSRIEALKNRA